MTTKAQGHQIVFNSNSNHASCEHASHNEYQVNMWHLIIGLACERHIPLFTAKTITLGLIDTLTEVRTTKNTVRRAQYTQIEV